MHISATSESAPRLSLPKILCLRGRAFGLRDRTALVSLRVRGASAGDAHRVDEFLRAVTGLEGTRPAARASAADALVATILDWSLAIQREFRLPVFGAWLRIGARAADGGSALLCQVAMPAASPITAAQTLNWLTRAANRALSASAPSAPAGAQAGSSYEELSRSLERAAPRGTNILHFRRAAFELGFETNEMPLGIVAVGTGVHTRWLGSSSTDRTSHLATRLCASKSATCVVLEAAGLPTPKNALASDLEHATRIARELGFPVVVKPDDQEQGRGVSADLRDETQVRQAFEEARKFSARILVEKHQHGRDIRLTVAKGKVVKIMGRERGGVIGDGMASIETLVRRAQQNPRAERLRRQYGRYLLDLDDEAQAMLAEQGLSGHGVPEPGRFVPLRRKNNISAGGTQSLLDRAEVHPDNLELAVRAAQVMRLDIAGVDLIIEDPARSWREGEAVITEVNSHPQIGISLLPEAYSVVLREVVGDAPHIPVHLVVTDGVGTAQIVPRLLALRASLGVRCLATDAGIWIDERRLQARFATAFDACLSALHDDQIESLVCAMSADEILRCGLPSSVFASCRLVARPGAEASTTGLRALAMARPHVVGPGGPAGPGGSRA